MNESEALNLLNNRFQAINSRASTTQGNLLAIANAAYEKKYKKAMPASKKAVLQNSVNQFIEFAKKNNTPMTAINSAVEDISKVDNPLSLLFSLMSIVVPNFAYTEVCGVQPMPTKESPIFYPELTAAESRNGITAGEALLGAQNWNSKNTYSTNKTVDNVSTPIGSASWTYKVTKNACLPDTVAVTIEIDGVGTTTVVDDGEGHLQDATGFITNGTVNYSTGDITGTIANYNDVKSLTVTYRYDFGASDKPAQSLFEWKSKTIRAYPYRLRSSYSLDNFYQAKQVLSGYDIDEVLSSSLAGYINKEISGNQFDEMLQRSDATYTWSSTAPNGVAWVLHRLSALQRIIEASNGIRDNVKRSAGNIIVAGTNWMNTLETLGEDTYKPENVSEEPIGPYVSGKLLGRFKVLKNQDYGASDAMMCYKRNETDASTLVGSFISLYSTQPLAKDDLTVVSGMGCQIGSKKVFDNSIVKLVYTN